jgi:glycerophosphoryl diester phosphodiesterase
MKIIGHRGWRGKYPENSLIGFEKLNELGIFSLELDVIVSKNDELIVSHEPWFDLNYCKTQKESNLFKLATAEIQKTDCGSVFYPNFPAQIKVPSVKPLFKSCVELWNSFETKPFIALEVKSEPKLYGDKQPFAEKFAQLLINFEKTHLTDYQYFVQSFDPYFLKVYHSLNPKTATGLLLENKLDIQKNIDFLGFVPSFINPEHLLLNQKNCTEILDLGASIYTWTVNEKNDFDGIKDFGISGIITDYPERFV